MPSEVLFRGGSFVVTTTKIEHEGRTYPLDMIEEALLLKMGWLFQRRWILLELHNGNSVRLWCNDEAQISGAFSALQQARRAL